MTNLAISMYKCDRYSREELLKLKKENPNKQHIVLHMNTEEMGSKYKCHSCGVKFKPSGNYGTSLELLE